MIEKAINRFGLPGLIVLMVALVLCVRFGFGAPMGDVNADGQFTKADYFELFFGSDIRGDLDGSGVRNGRDASLVFEDLIQRYTNRAQVLTENTILGSSGAVRISSSPVPRNDGQDVRHVWMDRNLVRQGDRPSGGTFAGIAVRVVSGGSLPNPVNPTLKLPNTQWSDWCLVGTPSSSAYTWIYLNPNANQLVIDWKEIHNTFDANGNAVTLGVSPKDINGNPLTPSTFTIRPFTASYVVLNPQLTPANPVDGQQVTPRVQFQYMANQTVTGTMIGSVDGIPNDGGTSVTATPGTTSISISLAPFMAQTGNHVYSVELRIDGQVSDTQVAFMVTNSPPPPAPTMTAKNLGILPSQPAPGQSPVPSFTLGISATMATTFQVVGTLDNANPLTVTGTRGAGNTTATVTMPAITVQGGAHTYRVAVSIPGMNVTTAATITFSVPLVDFSLTSVAMATMATAGNNVTATVTGRGQNLGAPFTVSLQAKDQAGNVLTNGSIVLPAGSDVTATAGLVFTAATGITGVTFSIDSAQQYAETNENNNTFGPLPLTVTAAPAGTTPTAPSITSAIVGSGQISLTFTTVSNATSYKVSSRTNLTTTTRDFLGSSPTPALTATSLIDLTEYFIGVQAMNTAGTSVLSTEAAVVPGIGLPVKIVILPGTELQQPTLQDPRTGFGNGKGWNVLNGALSYNSRGTSENTTETFNVTDATLNASNSEFWERGNRAAAAGKILAYGAHGTVAVVSAHRRSDGGADLQYGLHANGDVFVKP